MAAPDFTKLRRTAACAVIFDTEGRLLLVRRTDNARWVLPGGNIEVGETAAQAVVREVREETGYGVVVVRLIGVYSEPNHTTIKYPDGNVSSYVAIAFECKVVGGSATPSDESSAVEWFALSALPESFNPGHVPRVADALANQAAAFYR